MRNTPSDIGNQQVVIHNDDETPWDFVVELVRSVFGRSEADAKAVTTMVAQHGKAVCGVYPPAVADAMLATAQERIKEAGHPLLITVSPIGVDENDGKPHCAFCRKPGDDERTLFQGQTALICDACLLTGANHLSEVSRKRLSTRTSTSAKASRSNA